MLAGLLTSRLGIGVILVALVVAVIGVQTARLAHAQHDLLVARSALQTAKAAAKASEDLRRTEYAQARAAVTQAEQACAARVAEAHRSATRIRTLVEKPHASDPATGCPVRALLGAGELRDAVWPSP